MTETAYSSIQNHHMEGESSPFVGVGTSCSNGTRRNAFPRSEEENAQSQGTACHDRGRSYQNDAFPSTTREILQKLHDVETQPATATPASTLNKSISKSFSDSSQSLHDPHTEMVHSSPMTPKTSNRKTDESMLEASTSSEEDPMLISLHRNTEGRVSPSSDISKEKNPKTFLTHLSYIMTSNSNEDSFDDNPNESLSYFAHEHRGVKRGLLLFTIVFVLGTFVHRNFSGGLPQGRDVDSSKNGTDVVYHNDINPLANEEALMALKNSSAVSNVANAAVASDTEICSEMGLSIMRDLDGNAVDSAVTTALCLGLVNPASSGIGGGGFILIHSTPRKGTSATGRSTPFIDRRKLSSDVPQNISDSEDKSKRVTEVIDCRETAPGDATYNMFETYPPKASMTGALSIGIPGELRGLELAHERYGRLDWEKVLQPVIDLAENGVPVIEHLAIDIHSNMHRIDLFPSTKETFTRYNDGKNYLVAGEKMDRLAYTNTLKNVAANGADYIYKGKVASNIAKEIQSEGGIIKAEDLENYKPVLRDPLIAEVDGFNIVSIPPPSSGGATIIGALRFLSGYKKPFAAFSDTLSIHRMVESFKHVFAIRMSLSDPDFFTNETDTAVKDLVEGPLMEELRRKTSDSDILPISEYGGKWAQLHKSDDKEDAHDAHEGDRRLKHSLRQNHRGTRLFNYLEDHGTTAFSVVDKDRNVVSITSTVNYYFGSVYTSPSTGIIFNDQMDDFATPGRPNKYGLHPSESNYIAPNKRPLSSMSPTMVFDARATENNPSGKDLGKLMLSVGASGGPKIITAVIQIILNHLYLGMPLYNSIVHARVHDQLIYHGSAGTGFDQCFLPQGPLIETSQRTRDALKMRHQNIIPMDYLGTCQAISMDLETNLLNAVSDPRKLGKSAGY